MAWYCAECGRENVERDTHCPECGKQRKQADSEKGFLLDGRYEIIEIIKSGAMGCVYRARDTRLDNVVAVKKMIGTAGSDEDVKYVEERFREEARLLSTLHHGGLPKVIDYFVSDDTSGQGKAHFLVMTYVRGQDLDVMMRERNRRPLPVDLVIDYLKQILNILDYLHTRSPSVIYRDMKPSNVIIQDNKVFLVDFGIARLFTPARKGTLIGTPGYAAPEQYKGYAEPRSDLYSLGALMHYLLTGIDPEDSNLPPFSFEEISSQNADVPDVLDDLIYSMLEVVPDKRPFSARAALEILDHGEMPYNDYAAPCGSNTPGKKSKGRFFSGFFSTVSAIILTLFLLNHFNYISIDTERIMDQGRMTISLIMDRITEKLFHKPDYTQSPHNRLVFDRDKEGFMPMGEKPGTLSLSTDIPAMSDDKGSLSYDYVTETNRSAEIGTSKISLKDFRAINLSMKSKYSGTFAVALTEENSGARYIAPFELTGGTWETIKLRPADFRLSSKTGDKNHALDRDMIEQGIIISDLSGYKGKTGKNRFWISSITVIPENRSDEFLPVDTTKQAAARSDIRMNEQGKIIRAISMVRYKRGQYSGMPVFERLDYYKNMRQVKTGKKIVKGDWTTEALSDGSYRVSFEWREGRKKIDFTWNVDIEAEMVDPKSEAAKDLDEFDKSLSGTTPLH